MTTVYGFGRGKIVGEYAIIHRPRVLVQVLQLKFDDCPMKVGRMLAESLLDLAREAMAGPDDHPTDARITKWASQPGSVFIGGHTVTGEHPRLRGLEGESRLARYAMLQNPSQCAEALLTKTLA